VPAAGATTEAIDGTTFVVTTAADTVDGGDGVLSLREAVIQANSTVGHDTIALAPDTTYSLTRCAGAVDENAAQTGDLDLTDPAGVTVARSTGSPDSRATIVQTCAPDDRQRIVHNVGGGPLYLDSVALQGGAGDDGGAVLSNGPLSFTSGSVTGSRSRPSDSGAANAANAAAAVLVTAGELTVVDGRVAQNNAVGLANLSEAPTFIDHTIVENNGYGGATAGGIAVRGGGQITSTTVRSNTAVSGLGGGLSAISCPSCGDPRITVANSVFEQNFGSVGGGIFGDVDLADSALRSNLAVTAAGAAIRGSVVRSVVEGNLALQSGGGLYVRGAVEDTTVADNHAVLEIGGIVFESSSSLTRSTVAANTAPDVGGIHVSGAQFGEPPAALEVAFSTIAGNDADDEGGGVADELSTVPRAGQTTPGTITLRNSVVGEPGGVQDCAPGSNVQSLGGNFQPATSCAFGAGDVSDGGNPQLGPLLDNGGPTRTRLPAPLSPLIDRIGLADPFCQGVDQRGQPRAVGGGCDIGAVEAALTTSGFVAISPQRILDTRGGPVPPGRPLNLKLAANSVLDVPVRNVGGVPAEATAVVVNITSTEAASSTSYVTAWPSGFAMPLASTLNLQPAANVANSATVRIGPNGSISFFTNTGSTHLVADVLGYYTADATGGFSGITPTRALDTRVGPVPPGRSVGAPLAGPASLRLPLAGQHNVPAEATAVAVNITATQSSTDLAFVTVWPAGEIRPTASNLNLQPAFNVANLAVVKLGADKAVDLFTNVGSTHLIVDVVGYYRDGSGGRLVPLPPARLLDSRNGPRIAAGGTRDLQVTGSAGVPAGATAAVLNVTATDSVSATGFLTVYPRGASRPTASTLNYRPPFNVPNQALARLSANGGLALYSGAAASHVVVDAGGYFVES
jgi:CSLREA domain-containing protein